jgi:hypothetical protein
MTISNRFMNVSSGSNKYLGTPFRQSLNLADFLTSFSSIVMTAGVILQSFIWLLASGLFVGWSSCES